MNLKVLPLEGWMTSSWAKKDLETLEKMMPRQKRDGYYLLGDICWFEVEGKAYKFKRNSFVHSLSTKTHKLLRDTEYRAIGYLISNKIADKRLKKLYWKETEVRELRRTILEAKKWRVKWLKEK